MFVRKPLRMITIKEKNQGNYVVVVEIIAGR